MVAIERHNLRVPDSGLVLVDVEAMMQRKHRTTFTSACAGAASLFAHSEALKNHYGDPFIPVTNAITACPVPRGPFMTEAEAKTEAHPRIERGTSCFLAGKCSEGNAYRYDGRIAAAAADSISAAIRKSARLARSSIWLTVQRRFVFVQGCVTDRSQIERWAKLVKAVPEVEYVGVDLAIGHRTANFRRVPYPTMPK